MDDPRRLVCRKVRRGILPHLLGVAPAGSCNDEGADDPHAWPDLDFGDAHVSDPRSTGQDVLDLLG